MKSPSGKIMALEGARFLAAFSVMGLHFSTNLLINVAHFPASSLPLSQFLFAGAAPIGFFFTLSGFVMYNAHHQDFGRLRRLPRYVLSRVSRIYPLYWLSLFAGQAVWNITFHYWGFFPPPYFEVFSLAPLHTVAHTLEQNPVAWTLRYEMAFYIGFMLVFIPRIGPWLLGLWFGAVVWYCYNGWAPCAWASAATGVHPLLWPEAVRSHFVDFVALLFFTGLAGGFFYTHVIPGRRTALCLLAAASAALVWELWHDDGGQAFPAANYMIPCGLIFAFWIAAVSMAERAGAIPRFGWMRPLGVLSYPLYLLHSVAGLAFTFLLNFHPMAVHRLPGGVWFLALVAVSVIISAIAAWGIDRPLQTLVRRFLPA